MTPQRASRHQNIDPPKVHWGILKVYHISCEKEGDPQNIWISYKRGTDKNDACVISFQPLTPCRINEQPKHARYCFKASIKIYIRFLPTHLIHVLLPQIFDKTAAGSSRMDGRERHTLTRRHQGNEAYTCQGKSRTAICTHTSRD